MTKWKPPAKVLEVEERFAACVPIYQDLLTILRVHAHNNPALKAEVAVVSLIDLAFDLVSMSGLLWAADYDVVRALRLEADKWEQRRQNEPAPVIATLRDVLRAPASGEDDAA
jgi:hypothetical protein